MNQQQREYPDSFVSVIVTAYNQADTIRQTLETIIAQKCNFPIEIIIGDDNSKDGTRDICLDYQKLYPKIIRLLFHQENMGVAANFASSVKKAKGKYVAICAADDFWHNSFKLQLQVDFLENNPDYGLIYTDYDKIDFHSGKIIRNYLKTLHKKIYEGTGLIKAFFNGQVPALTLTVMFRKDLFDNYVPSDDYIKYHFPLEDWPTWLILSKYTRIGYLPVSTGTYRFGHESITNPVHYIRMEERLKQEQIMYKYICEMFPEDLTYNESNYLLYANHVLLNLAYKKMDYTSAVKYSERMKNIGSFSFKQRIVKYKPAFFVFSFLKRLKEKLSHSI